MARVAEMEMAARSALGCHGSPIRHQLAINANTQGTKSAISVTAHVLAATKLINKPALRIHLFKKTQNPASDAPAHVIAQSLACQIVSTMSVKTFLDEKGRIFAIQLRTNETLKEIKQRFAPVKSAEAKTLPIRDWRECLLISYPIADQRSNPAY